MGENEEQAQQIQRMQLRLANVISIEERTADYNAKKKQFNEEVERLNRDIMDKVVENDLLYQQKAQAELRLKD